MLKVVHVASWQRGSPLLLKWSQLRAAPGALWKLICLQPVFRVSGHSWHLPFLAKPVLPPHASSAARVRQERAHALSAFSLLKSAARGSSMLVVTAQADDAKGTHRVFFLLTLLFLLSSLDARRRKPRASEEQFREAPHLSQGRSALAEAHQQAPCSRVH